MEPAVTVVLDRAVDSPRPYSTGHLGDTRFSWLQGELEASSLAGGGPTAGGTLSDAGERSFTTQIPAYKKSLRQRVVGRFNSV